MAEAILDIGHTRGAREVTEVELARINPPPPSPTWFPLAHTSVLDTVRTTLSDAGFAIGEQRLAVSNQDHRFFGTLILKNAVNDSAGLAVGIRNSTDKSFPIAFAVGSQVYVCSNLAFSSEIQIARRHTRFGEDRFNEAVARAVQGLHQYQFAEGQRIERMQNFSLSEDAANSYMLQAFEKSIVSSRLLPHVIKEWREPKHDEFLPRTSWSLFNSFTEVLKDRFKSNPQQAALSTIRLQRLLSPSDDRPLLPEGTD